jgi:diadenosine tetraphosphate (Ap4A) HIT family hydrolase
MAGFAGWRRFAGYAVVFTVGVALGGWGVRDVQPRSFLGVDRGRDAASLAELTGLVGSAVVQNAPWLLPTVMTTARSVVVHYPFPGPSRVHLVVIPRRDIYDPGTLAHGDEAYLVDAFATLDELIRREHLTRYKIIANGPDLQTVRYLHFHLVSLDDKRSTIGSARDTLRYDAP